jgi:hypothetical protein
VGWNKQSGEHWTLQRSQVFVSGKPGEKMLELKVIGLLTIEDATKLCGALAAEIQAAERSEGTKLFLRQKLGIDLQPYQERIMEQISYGSSVLQNWDDVLGTEPDTQWKRPPADLADDDGCPND